MNEWGGYVVLLVLVAILNVGLWLRARQGWLRTERQLAERVKRLHEQLSQQATARANGRGLSGEGDPPSLARNDADGHAPKSPEPRPILFSRLLDPEKFEPMPSQALPPELITCPRCKQPATAWLTYADGRRECLLCTLRKRKP